MSGCTAVRESAPKKAFGLTADDVPPIEQILEDFAVKCGAINDIEPHINDCKLRIFVSLLVRGAHQSSST